MSSEPPATPQTAEGDPRSDLRWGTIPRLLDDVAASRPDAPALLDGDRRLTFADLSTAAGEVSRGLMAEGVQLGDRVAIWAPNSAAWVVAALGAVGAGAVLVTINTRFKGGEAAYVLRRSGAKILFTIDHFLGVDYPALLAAEDLGAVERLVLIPGAERPMGSATGATGAAPAGVAPSTFSELVEGGQAVSGDAVADRSRAVRPGDPSDILFTSGTTGRPKGALSTHAQSLRTFGTWASIVGLRSDDRYLVVNPFFHTFGYKAGLLACLMTGSALVPEPVFDVNRVLQRVAEERITVLPGPPTLYQSILDSEDRDRFDLTSLRLGVTGAAVVPVELVVAMKEELGFDTVLTAYGLTESCGTVTMCRRGDSPERVANTSGRAIPGLEVRVAGPDGELAPGEPGEIQVRGYTVMSGYWQDPEASAEAVDADGWLHTGDVGTMDADGYLRITDRLKDMYVVGGFNAYPAEIEAILRDCPVVRQVAVIGVPDPRLGEVGCAYVVPESASAGAGTGPDGTAKPGVPDGDVPAAVISWSRERMANFKVPRYVEVIGALPANASGKVLKTELRRRFTERPAVPKEVHADAT